MAAVLSCRKTARNNRVEPQDFLAASKYEKLKIEIQSVSGMEPDAATISAIKSFLEARLNKPGGISITSTSIASPNKDKFTIDDIKKIEKNHRNANTSGSELTAYILFIDGQYNESSGSASILGVAYEGSSMVIFENTIRNFSGGLGQPSRATLETTVSLHEIGHILGLVNNGSKMAADHQDIGHGSHCNNNKCLMYYSAETSDIIANIMGGVPTLDAACLADLKQNGGK